MARYKLEDVMGEYLRTERSGREAIHVCKLCGSPNLSVNLVTGLWQCWAGCASGKEGHLSPLVVKTMHNDELVSKARDAWCTTCQRGAEGFILDKMQERHPTTAPRPAYEYIGNAAKEPFIFQGYLSLPLLGRDGFVGYQSYISKGQYRIQGRRGICWYDPVRLGFKYGDSSVVLVCEGFWDFLSMILHQPKYIVCCTAGANLTSYQLSLLVSWLDRYTRVLIAFDNDRLSLAGKAHNMLHPHFPNTHLFLPPTEVQGRKVKDWDDFLHFLTPEQAEHYFAKREI